MAQKTALSGQVFMQTLLGNIYPSYQDISSFRFSHIHCTCCSQQLSLCCGICSSCIPTALCRLPLKTKYCKTGILIENIHCLAKHFALFHFSQTLSWNRSLQVILQSSEHCGPFRREDSVDSFCFPRLKEKLSNILLSENLKMW